MITLLHSSINQELFKKYACNQSSHYEEIQWYHAPQLKLNIHYPSLLAIFNSLHSSMNQELLEKHLCNQSRNY